MRSVRAFWGFVAISAAMAGTWFAVHRTDNGRGPVFRGHVMDRRCRGGCTTSSSPPPVVNFALLTILPNGPAPGIQGTDAGMYTDAGVLVQDVRDSGTYCTKADGTLAWLGNDTLCIEDAGIRHEGPSANLILYSTAVGGTGWSSGNDGIAAPVISLNDATCGAAPDGTLTATKITFPASTTTEQYSMVWRSDANGKVGSYYAWNPSGSSTFYGCRYNAPASYTPCSLTTSPTRCTNICGTDTCQYFFLGTDTRATACNEPTMAAQTVCLWGAQDEPVFSETSFPSSFIPTTSAVMARDADHITTTNTLTDAGVFALGVTFTPMAGVWEKQDGGSPYQSVVEFATDAYLGGGPATPPNWGIRIATNEIGTIAGRMSAVATDGSGNNLIYQAGSRQSAATHRYVMGVNGSAGVVLIDGTQVGTMSGVDYAGGLGAQPGPMHIGDNSWGWFNNIRADADINACQ